jgi:hypothetical protein
MKRATNKQTNKQTKLNPTGLSPSLTQKATPQKTAPEEALLRTQVATIEKIRYLSHAHPLFKNWDRQNRRFLEERRARPYFERYRLILFSEPRANGFVFRKPSVSWKDKEYYQRGLQRARIFFKSMLWELKETRVKAKT